MENISSLPSNLFHDHGNENEDLLTLSLSLSTTSRPKPGFSYTPEILAPSLPGPNFPYSPKPIPGNSFSFLSPTDPNPPPSLQFHGQCQLPTQDTVVGSSRQKRVRRRSPNQTLRPGKTETIPPPYPWATNKRALVHSLQNLLSNGITTISGRVQCKKCDGQFDIEHDLQKKFTEVAAFIGKNRDDMRHRAPAAWMNPVLPDCSLCGQHNCVKPIPTKKKAINWLFLLLGQMIGCCKLSELKYFCKHTKNHRTGAKDRVLYLTYLELCKQLDPDGPFDP